MNNENEKEKEKVKSGIRSLKVRLLTIIPMFFIVLTLAIVGVFAASTVTLNINGTITFHATDIYATVDGSFSGISGTAPSLSTLSYSADSEPDETALGTWQNLSLNFDSSGTNVVATITIENLSNERQISGTITDNSGTTPNLTRTISETSFTVGLGATKVITITFSVTDKNTSVLSSAFNFAIDLQDGN